MIKKFTLVLFLAIAYSATNAQTTLPNLPYYIKWQQVNTTHFKIIFPKGFESQGQRMANTLAHLYQPIAGSLNGQPRKIDIILQNQHAVSNGFVTLGPRRSEFYTLAPQNYNFTGNNDWLDMLAIHEFRHVVQYDKSRTGFTKFVGYLLGDYARNAVASGAVPSWFWEGDAVGIETALTHSGRGRFPNFSMAFRANLLENGALNYSKQYLRSFKDFIPNHYVLGYHFTTYIKNKYGAKALEDIVKKTWNVPFIPFKYSFAMEQLTGKKMPELYQQMMADLKKKWESQIGKEKLTTFMPVSKRLNKRFTNYFYPQPIDGGDILVLKSGLDDIQQFVSINTTTGKEKKEFEIGPLNNPGFSSVAGNTLVWTEYRFDPRWLVRSYSIVNSLNLVTSNLTQLTFKSRYSAASISPDRSKIVLIETTSDYKNRVVVIDAYSGKVLKAFENFMQGFYSMPRWDNKGETIVVLNQKNQKKGVLQLDYESGEEKILLPYSFEHIGHPVIWNTILFYNSAYSGIDNIYALNLSTQAKYRVTSAKYGGSNPSISLDGEYIYYNNYTVEGNDVVKIAFDEKAWQSLEKVENTDIQLYQQMVEKEAQVNVLFSVPDSTYQIKKYKKNPVNIHSWGPLFNGSSTDIEIGVYSKNSLSTTDLFAGVHFDNVGNVKGVGRISYQSMYPIIDLAATYGTIVTSASYRDSLGINHTDRLSWTETTVKAGLRIPWVLTRSKYNTKIEVSNNVGVTSVSNFQSRDLADSRYFFNQIDNGNLVQNEFVSTMYNLLNQSKRDIYSKFGQTITFENYSTPYGGNLKGGLTALKAQLFFPGFVKHHSINFFVGWQHQNIKLSSDEYRFNNRMPYPRGYAPNTFKDFYTLRSNYDLPLLYPDFKFGPFLYIQRIKAKLFYDYGYGKTDVINNTNKLEWKTEKSFQSAGFDLTFDFNVMRALPLLELGVRYVYLPDLQQSKVEFLIGSIGF